MNRKFFYVIAAVLLLAIASNWRAREAAGQVVPEIEATCYDNGAFYAVFGGAWHQVDAHTGSSFVTYPLPVQAPVAGTGGMMVLYKNGDLYVHEGFPGAWVLKGNVFGGAPTPALRQSWGQVKARYQGAPATSATPRSEER